MLDPATKRPYVTLRIVTSFTEHTTKQHGRANKFIYINTFALHEY